MQRAPNPRSYHIGSGMAGMSLAGGRAAVVDQGMVSASGASEAFLSAQELQEDDGWGDAVSNNDVIPSANQLPGQPPEEAKLSEVDDEEEDYI